MSEPEVIPKVEPIDGEIFRFLVLSDVTEERYVCDLQEARWSGWCTCPHFLCRLAPRIAQGEKGPSVRCKHLRLSREFFLDFIMPKLAKAMGQEEPDFEGPPPSTEYLRLRKVFLEQNRKCAVFPALEATETHHSRGKLSSLYLDKRFWIPVSRLGHIWIHNHPDAARKRSWYGVPLLCARGEWNTPPK